jgi:hypothetical protein
LLEFKFYGRADLNSTGLMIDAQRAVASTMCPVCDGCTFHEVSYKSSSGAVWPALECAECGAVTQSRHVAPESSRRVAHCQRTATSGTFRKTDSDSSAALPIKLLMRA